METKRFLQSVLAREGWYCVLAIHAETSRRKQKFYDSIDQLMDANTAFDQNGYNSYYAVGTFGTDASREADNIARKRAFYLDLDCEADNPKKFPDQATALQELRRFCKVMRLPKPITVDSGRGIHVYWPLNEDVTLAEWVPVAERLKAKCKEHGFKADPAVTSDAARILRMPGTHNHKDNPPKRVRVLGMDAVAPVSFDKFSELMGNDPIPVPKKFTPVSGSNAVMDALMGNREHYFKDIMLKTAKGKGCMQLAYIYRNQETMSEPLWRAGLSIAKHCADGDSAATKISQRHPEFTPDEMFNKMDRIKGPYLCTTFDEYNDGVCSGCPLWGKIKSPVVLGSRTREATEADNVIEVAPSPKAAPAAQPEIYVIPTYPKPYFRGANGGIYVRGEDADGDTIEKCIYHNDLYIVRRVTDGDADALVFRLHLPKDGVREFTVPQIAVTSKDEFRKAIGAKGVTAFGKNLEELMAYTIRWIEELQQQGAADIARAQFGWADDNCGSFILGDREIFPDRIDFNPASIKTAGLFDALTPRGTLDGWRQNAEFFNKPGMELYQFALCASFGSALMHSSPMNGGLLHMFSKDSGLGKTTAMFMALSVWGRPMGLLLKERDTMNHRMNRAEVYKNILFATDEITNMRPLAASDMTYAITEGMQRGRMEGGANQERTRGFEWKFLALSTGNMSLVEKITLAKAAPKAEAQRVLEARVDKFFDGSGDKAMTDDFSKNVPLHYGHAGVVFVQHYMQNMDGINALEEKVRERVDIKCNLGSSNRFWSEYITKTMTAAIIAKKLGLVNYDTAAMFKFAIELVRYNQGVTEDMTTSSSQILADFFAEHNGNLLIIKRNGDVNGIDALIMPEANPRTKLVARYESDTKKAFILLKPFKTWCLEQQIDYSSCILDLVKNKGATKRKMRITKGTNLRLPPVDVIEVDFELDVEDADGSDT